MNGTQQETATGTMNTGAQYNLTTSSGWTSSKTSVFTVIGFGLVRGVAAGSAMVTATANLPVPMQACNGQSCQNSNYSNSGGGNVGPYQVEFMSPIAQGTFPAGECPTGGQNPGYLRAVNNQVQYFGGAGYPYSVTAADLITVGSRHDLGTGTSTSIAQTASDGSFYDGYSICSTACPGSTGETDALQYWTVNGLPLFHVDSVVYKCTSITIDGR